MSSRRVVRLSAAPLAFLLAAAAAPAPLAPDQRAADRIHADVQFLASDEFEGRDSGSRGHAVAAQYVAARFTGLGLKPGGPGGSWYVQVPLRRATHVKPPQVSIVTGGGTRPVSDADVGLRPSLTERQRSFSAGLVFVGHGVVEPRFGIDEYAGLDVRNKIVVMIRGAPRGLPSDVVAHLELVKDEIAASKGAIGIAELSLGNFNPAVGVSQQPVVDWVDRSGAVGNAASRIAALVLSPALSRQLFEGAPKSLNQISKSGGGPLGGFALPARLSITDQSRWQDFSSPEVIGLLPGRDARLSQELVVLMAHLDHLGVKADATPGEDAIYNGALDNAAGIATMLETAREFAKSSSPPRRSVLFVANTGEELGLLGADYFASHPTVALKQIVAAINLDMPLLLYDFTDLVAHGAEHSTVGHAVAGAAAAMSIKLAPDPLPQENLFTRSDHYRFVVRGIPGILLTTGPANGGRQAWARFLTTTYHSPRDDLRQPINWRAGARYSEIAYRVARALADADARPRWYRGDYFGDLFAPGQPRAER